MKFRHFFENPEKEKKSRMDQAVSSLQKKVGYPLNDRELLENIGNLSFELEKRSEKYKILMSDEASGRIPALIFRKIINKNRKENELEPVDFRAITGGKGLSPEKKSAVSQLLDEIADVQDGGSGKALLVTEYINTGSGLSWLTDLLEEKDIDFDIAAISITGSKDYFPPSISNHLLPGTRRGAAGLHLYDEHERSGIYKNTNSDSPFPEKYSPSDQEKINKTREDINKIANTFYSVIKNT